MTSKNIIMTLLIGFTLYQLKEILLMADPVYQAGIPENKEERYRAMNFSLRLGFLATTLFLTSVLHRYLGSQPTLFTPQRNDERDEISSVNVVKKSM